MKISIHIEIEADASELAERVASAIEAAFAKPEQLPKPEAPPVVSIAGGRHTFRRYRER